MDLTAHDLTAIRKMVLPIYTTAQRNAIINPVTCEVIGNSTTGQLEYWTGAAWAPVTPATTVYWSRAGIIVSPVTAGDSVSLGTGILRNTAIASLIDANGKFQPVEILGTNLPANTGFFTGSTFLWGVPGVNKCSVYMRDYATYADMQFCSNAAPAFIFTWDSSTFYLGTCIQLYATSCLLDKNMAVTSAKTIDGLDISEYITAWQGNRLLVTCEAAGYTNCVAGDKLKPVTAAGNTIGFLIDYNNTTRVWTINSINFVLPGGASAMAITGGTGAGTSVAAAPTEAPTRQQNVKKINLPYLKLDGAGALTVYLTSDGTAGGTALFAQRPSIIISPYSATMPTKALSADFKTLTLAAGGAADYVDIMVAGAVA